MLTGDTRLLGPAKPIQGEIFSVAKAFRPKLPTGYRVRVEETGPQIVVRVEASGLSIPVEVWAAHEVLKTRDGKPFPSGPKSRTKRTKRTRADQVAEFVATRPGCKQEEIRAAIGGSRAAVQAAVQQARREDRIRSEGHTSLMRYYPPLGTPAPTVVAPPIPEPTPVPEPAVSTVTVAPSLALSPRLLALFGLEKNATIQEFEVRVSRLVGLGKKVREVAESAGFGGTLPPIDLLSRFESRFMVLQRRAEVAEKRMDALTKTLVAASEWLKRRGFPFDGTFDGTNPAQIVARLDAFESAHQQRLADATLPPEPQAPAPIPDWPPEKIATLADKIVDRAMLAIILGHEPTVADLLAIALRTLEARVRETKS